MIAEYVSFLRDRKETVENKQIILQLNKTSYKKIIALTLPTMKTISQNCLLSNNRAKSPLRVQRG